MNLADEMFELGKLKRSESLYESIKSRIKHEAEAGCLTYILPYIDTYARHKLNEDGFKVTFPACGDGPKVMKISWEKLES